MLKQILQGMVVGIANIIPGVSGGTMMVAMGLYDHLIHAITHLKSEFKKSMKLLIPIFLGAGIAIVVLSRLFEYLLEVYPIPTNFAFCGLIAGSLPFIFKKVKGHSVTVGKIIPFLIFFGIVITMALLGESDIKISTTKRTLLVQSSNFPIEVLFLRDDDIPQTVATGVADLGIVGENEFMEKEEDAEIIKRLGFSKCRLSLAMPKDIEYPGLSWFNGKKIATSYPVILRNFLKEKGVNAEIHVITGSVEVSPGIGLADAIFDIVSSGSTLVSNRLKEVEVVMKSEALLIGNKNMSDEKKEVLNELLFRMNAVKTAEDKKYVLMNAPKDKLEEIIAVLPGMKSPTVMPLAQEGWCSVHTVLDEKRFWEIIGKLKALGAEGILVLPIEKMIV